MSFNANQIQDLLSIFRTPNGVFAINPSVLFATTTNSATGQTISGFDLNHALPAGFALSSVRGAL